mmetsp:Transcript_25524/g.59118  ORF Transcript_25524/g.59118 Transcript_25524/m.59118 type:complete len:109 (+) Transcript_25524:303-629(+)
MLHKLLVDQAPPPRARKSHPSLAAEYRLALAGWGAAIICLLVGLVSWLPLLVYTATGIVLFSLLSAAGGIDNIEVFLKSCVARPLYNGGIHSRLAPRRSSSAARSEQH